MLEKQLSECGLHEEEASVYSAILNTESITLEEVARRSKLSRSRAKQCLNSLTTINLILVVVHGKRKRYVAKHPKALLQNAQTQLDSLTKLLPSLVETFEKVGGRPRITMHDGAEGIIRVTRDAIESASYLKSFSSPSTFMKILSRKDADDFMAVIVERQIKSQSLCSSTKENLKLIPTLNSTYNEFRLLPDKIVHSVEFIMYNNITVVTSWHRKFSIVIESQDITLFVEAIFDDLWSKAKPV